MKKISLFIFSLLLVQLAFAVSGGWEISSGYSVKFTNPRVSGVFNKMHGDIVFDEKNLPASKFNVAIETASINTGNGMRNSHAKSKDWLDAKKYPEIRFTSNQITKNGNSYMAKGTLQMHGVSKEMSIPFTFDGQKFAGSFTLNWKDFGMNGGGGGNDPNVKIELSVPVSRK